MSCLNSCCHTVQSQPHLNSITAEQEETLLGNRWFRCMNWITHSSQPCAKSNRWKSPWVNPDWQSLFLVISRQKGPTLFHKWDKIAFTPQISQICENYCSERAPVHWTQLHTALVALPQGYPFICKWIPRPYKYQIRRGMLLYDAIKNNHLSRAYPTHFTPSQFRSC
jgi:hypothetical protein